MLCRMFFMLLLHNMCPCAEVPSSLYFLPPMGVRAVGLRLFLTNPLVGIANRVWPLSSLPCLGLIWRSCYMSFRLWSPCQCKTMLRALDRDVWPGGWTRDALLVRGSPLSQEVSEVCWQVWFNTQLLIHLKLDLLPQFFFFWWRGVLSPCPVLLL